MPLSESQRNTLKAFAARHPIARLGLFGSVLRGEERPDSDLDLLVEFEPDAPVGLLAMAAMELELEAELGRKVDLRTKAELSHYFRDQVVQSADMIYAS